MSKTREAFYAGWRAGARSKVEHDAVQFTDPDAAWCEFEKKLALRPSLSQVCERLVVLFCVLAVLGFVVAPLLIKLEWVAR
jgi:hypothetical protein